MPVVYELLQLKFESIRNVLQNICRYCMTGFTQYDEWRINIFPKLIPSLSKLKCFRNYSIRIRKFTRGTTGLDVSGPFVVSVGSSCGSCRNPEIHPWNQIRLWSSLQRQDAAARQGHHFFSVCAVIIISSTYTRSSPPKWKPNKTGAGIITSQYALNIVNR